MHARSLGMKLEHVNVESPTGSLLVNVSSAQDSSDLLAAGYKSTSHTYKLSHNELQSVNHKCEHTHTE